MVHVSPHIPGPMSDAESGLRELRTGEVRRSHLLGTSVNKDIRRAGCLPSNTLWRLLVRLTLPQPWSSKRSKGSHARVTMLIAEAGGDTARAAAARLHAHRIPEFAITIVEARLKNVAVL